MCGAIRGSQATDQFVGRTSELALLADCLKSRNGPALVGVHGEAGVGKSRLAREFARRVEEAGGLAVQGRWYERAGAPPYTGFLEVLRGLARSPCTHKVRAMRGRLTRLERRLLGVDGERPVYEPAPRQTGELHDTFHGVLADFARRAPLVVVLDDLHWAGEASLALLLRLARGAAPRPSVVIVLWRDEVVAPGASLGRALDVLRHDGLMLDRPLGGLSAAETGLYVECLAGRPLPREGVARLHALTVGNPLFVREILRHSLDRGEVDDLVERLERPGWGLRDLPESVGDAVHERLEEAPASVRGVLASLAVLGEEFELGSLRTAGLLTEEQLSRDVPAALRLGFLQERRYGVDVHLAFSHPLMGASLYQSLDPVTRATHHRRVALALERAPGRHRASRIAYHLIEGQDAGDRPRAVRYMVEAARDSGAALAYEEAHRYWRQAFALLETGVRVDDGERTQWTREYADACSLAGYPDEALDLYRGLLGEMEPDGDPALIRDLYADMGWTVHNHGRRSEVAHYLERALPTPDVPPSSKNAALLAVHAVGLLGAGRLGEGRPFMERALEMVRNHPELESEGIVSQLGLVWNTWDPAGDPTQVPVLAEAAQDFYRRQGKVWSWTRVQIDAAVSWFFLGEIERSRDCLASAIESGKGLGATMLVADATAFCAYIANVAGDFDAADADIAACAPYLVSAGTSIYSEGLQRGLALRHLWQGRPAEARAEIQKVDSFLCAALEPHLLLAEGDAAGAAAAVAALAAGVPSQGSGGVWLMFALSCASALCALGRAEEAARWYESLERYQDWSMDWWQPRLELARIAAGNRWWRRAFDHFDEAVVLFDGRDWRPFAAIARLEYAEARAGRRKPGDRQRAAALLEEASPVFEGLGMPHYAARAAALNRRLSRGRRISAGPAHLSPQELRVLKAMVGGLSNRQIAGQLRISRRTVETHVAHILSKLDARSRSAATAEAVRRGLA